MLAFTVTRAVPRPVRAAAGAAVDRTADLALGVSAAVLPRVMGVAVPAISVARYVIVGGARRLGLLDADEHVVHVWPAGTTTPGVAHVVAEEALAEPGAPRGDVRPYDLPVEGWDELSLASARQRVRLLGPADVEQLLAYEREHGGRPGVLLALERRLARLAGG